MNADYVKGLRDAIHMVSAYADEAERMHEDVEEEPTREELLAFIVKQSASLKETTELLNQMTTHMDNCGKHTCVKCGEKILESLTL